MGLNLRYSPLEWDESEQRFNYGFLSGTVLDYTIVDSVGETLNAHLIKYGTLADPIVFAPSAAGSHSAIQMYMTADDAPTGLSLAAVRAKVTYTGTAKATAYGGLFWVKLDCQDGSGYTGDYLGGTPAGVQGVIEVPVNAVYTSANEHSWITGVAGEVRPLLGDIAKTGVISGLRAVINATDELITAGRLVGLHVGAYGGAGGVVDAGVLVLPHIGSTITTGLHVDSTYGTITTGINIGTCATRAINILNATGTASLSVLMLDSTYTRTGSGWHHGGVFKMRYKPDGSGAADFRACQGICFIGADANSDTVTGEFVGVYGQLHFYDTTVLEGTGLNAAITATVSSGGTPVFNSGHIMCLHLQNNLTINAQDTSNINTYIMVDGDHTANEDSDYCFDSVLHIRTHATPYLLDFENQQFAPGMLDFNASPASDGGAVIRCRIDDTDYFINLHTDSS